MTNHSIFYCQQCLFREDNGKLITESNKFTSVREIEGEDMIEVRYLSHALQNNPLLSFHHLLPCLIFLFQMVTAGSETFICRSKRV